MADQEYQRYSQCRHCGKRGYPDRRAAKQKARAMNDRGLSVYRCRHGGFLWHVGHLWDEVVAGEMSRDDIAMHAPRSVR